MHHDMVYGIFLNNSYKSEFNFGASNRRFSSFSADDGDMDYYFFHGDSVAEVIQLYTQLTGTMSMPPLWSMGFQQCRYSYYPDTEVMSIARNFREKDIPADAIVLDIHYMDAYKVFTWDKERFPDHVKMIRDLKKQGFKVVVIIDPGIKIEKGYPPYEEGKKKALFAKLPDHSLYEGEVWPGWCHFPDFTNPETRDWWGKSFAGYVKDGVEGFWNDMNEPASWGNFYPNNVVFDFDGQQATSKRARNVYGMQMARSTFDGTKKLMKRRPFNLTRSAFAGVQRYSAVWTGDNVASEEHMLLGVRLVNSLGMSGVSFSGCDIGGFFGDSSAGLFARWLSVGTFSPFFRVHSSVNSLESDPWSYGEEVEQIARNYIKLRYQMMPYTYSLFYESSRTGIPISRSLAIAYHQEEEVFDQAHQNQFTFGPFIMVAPVESTKEYCPVYLPKGEWYDFHSGEFLSGGSQKVMPSPLEKLPILVKGGAIIPMQNSVSSTDEKPEEVMHLHVYKGSQGSQFEYYEDDGSTYEYQNGAYYKRLMRYKRNMLVLEKVEGKHPTHFKKIELVLHGFKNKGQISVDGKKTNLRVQDHRFTAPIEKIDPLAKAGSEAGETVLTATFRNLNKEMVITL